MTFVSGFALAVGSVGAALALQGDVDGNTFVESADLSKVAGHLTGIAPLTGPSLARADVNGDGVVDVADIVQISRITSFAPAALKFSSPTNGEGGVSVSRETILQFTGPLDPATINATSIAMSFGGGSLAMDRHLSPDQSAVTLFYTAINLPASARIRVAVNGDLLRDLRGFAVDADNDGQPGGTALIEFDTLSITSIPGTTVCGRVFASELATGAGATTDSLNVPLQGVRISVTGADSTIFAVTDSLGNFRLENAPGGRFFVHIDGRLVTSALIGGQTVATDYPAGPYYPFVGKAWESVAGAETNIGEIYLPLVTAGTLQTVSASAPTTITFPPDVLTQYPGLAGVELTIPPDSLYSDNGERGGMVGIAPVASSRIPSPLPLGLDPALVITVQTNGPSNFDSPVPVCFPNLPNPVTHVALPPGAKSALWSFNHDTGRWEVRGSMTVSDDGRLVCSDPGVGITSPGWHLTDPATSGSGGPVNGPASQSGEAPGNNDCRGKGKNPTDPVNLFSGEFTESVTDLEIQGRGMNFAWSRGYRSHLGPNTAMGNHWDYAYNIWLSAEGADLGLHNGAGRADVYRLRPDGSWSRPEFFQELTKNPDGSFTLVFPDKETWEFYPLNGAGSQGRIKSIRDRNFNQIGFGYNGLGRLTTIHDTLDTAAHNRDITIGYDGAGRIASVTDFTGRAVRYAYYNDGDAGGSAGDLKSAATPAVTGAVTGNNFPNGKITSYTYSKGFADERLNHNLLTITDGRRNEPTDPTHGAGPILTNVYSGVTDSADINFDRVVEQIWGGPGDKIEMVYLEENPSAENGFAVQKTIVNDRVGNVREFYYDRGNRTTLERQYTGRAAVGTPTTDFLNRPTGKLRATDPDSFETRFEYNTDSQQKRVIHPNGNITEYVYESDLDPAAPARMRGNVRTIRHLAGSHVPVGDYAVIEEHFEYGELGGCCGFNFVTRHTDGRGNDTVNTYDSRGNLTRVVHKIASVVEDFEYNNLGQLTAHVLPDNGTGWRRRDEYSYYDAGSQRGYIKQEIADKGGLNLTTTFEHDAVGNPTKVTDPRGNDTQYVYNQLNQVIRTLSAPVAAGAGTVRYGTDTFYDASDNVVRVDVQNIDEQGQLQANAILTSTMEYGPLGELIRETNEVDAGHSVVTEHAYDGNRNRILTRTGEAVNGNQPTNTIATLYDERDMPFRSIRAGGSAAQSTTQIDYDANGSPVAAFEGLENSPRSLTREYDGQNRLVKTTDAMGNVVLYHYDQNGNVLSERAEGELADVAGSAGNVRMSEKTFVYDALNRLTRRSISHFNPATQAVIGDGVSVSDFTYNDNSQITSVKNDNLHTSTFGYDSAGRKTSAVDPRGNVNLLTYDAAGNVIAVGDTEKQDLGGPDQVFNATFAYDALDRKTSDVDPSGNRVDYAYDSRGNLTREMDARRASDSSPGNIIAHAYDGLNRVISTTRNLTSDGTGAGSAAGFIQTAQTYDDNSRVVSMTDDNGNATQYGYDALDRQISETAGDGSVRTMEYDVHGNMIGGTDANGTAVASTFDALNRLTARAITSGAGVSRATTLEGFAYDGLSQLVQAVNNSATIARQYDSLSLMTKDGINGKNATAVWDGVGNLKSLTYPGGRTITRAFDALERAQTIANQGGSTIAAYSFSGPSRVIRRDYGNGTRAAFGYDGIEGVANPAGDLGARQIIATAHSVIASSAVLDSRSYKWDAEGNKTRRADATPGGRGLVHDYSYDSVQRMIASVRTPGAGAPATTNYQLDGANNRLQVTGGADAGAYALSATAPNPADAAVNQYTTTPFDARAYDANGDLTAINPAGPGTRAFVYDYANRLVGHTNSGDGAVYAYDALGRRISKTLAGSVAKTENYYYFGSMLIEERDGADATRATYVYGRYVDEVLQMRRGANDFYYHEDDMHNVVKLTNAAGAVVESYEYGDFGEPEFVGSAGQTLAASAVGNPWLFTGRRYDDETGLYEYRTRYLDPRSGRFITRDTIGTWGDPLEFGNAYAYAGNSPFGNVDPFGTSSSQTKKVVKGVAKIVKEGYGAYGRRLKSALEADKLRAARDIVRNGYVQGWAPPRFDIKGISDPSQRLASASSKLSVVKAANFAVSNGLTALGEGMTSMNTTNTGAVVRVGAVTASNYAAGLNPYAKAAKLISDITDAGVEIYEKASGNDVGGPPKAFEVYNNAGRAVGVLGDVISSAFGDDVDCNGRPKHSGWKSVENFVNQAKTKQGSVSKALVKAGEWHGDWMGDVANWWSGESARAERLEAQRQALMAGRR